jgi:hypothetical protein
MSNLVNKESVKSLMTVIRRNAEQSSCIDRFEELLKEIKDERVVRAVVSDMNKFIEEVMPLFKDIDKMENLRYKSKILNSDFIEPWRFFKKTRHYTNMYIGLNAAINFYFTNNIPNEVTRFVIGKRNLIGDVVKKQYYSEKKIADKAIENLDYVGKITKENYLDYQEECRKVILLYNYIPAQVKAIIQTKRRNLGLDKNSLKFNKTNNETKVVD